MVVKTNKKTGNKAVTKLDNLLGNSFSGSDFIENVPKDLMGRLTNVFAKIGPANMMAGIAMTIPYIKVKPIFA